MHTVSSADPLDDLPGTAAELLRRELLGPVQGDLGGRLERCEAVSALLDRWQDAFFAALPVKVDREEETRWAAEAGLCLEDLESQWEDDWDDHPQVDDDPQDLADPDGLDDLDNLDALDGLDGLDGLEGLEGLDGTRPLVPPVEPTPLADELVAELERALLLLPLRVRLEALVAASALVDAWAELLADHEKTLGHLVLAHGEPQQALGHERLVDRHAALHRDGPGHP